MNKILIILMIMGVTIGVVLTKMAWSTGEALADKYNTLFQLEEEWL